MAMDFATMLNTAGFVPEWASTVVYNARQTDDQKNFTEAIDQIARKVGETGKDANGELATLMRQTFTTEAVQAPDELISAMFDEGSIGEFDDFYVETEPENTMAVFPATEGGNVPRSYIEHDIFKPKWQSLQGETDFKFKDLRYGGYKTVAKAVENINEKFALGRCAAIFGVIDAAIASGGANYIDGSGAAMPTEALADALALYLHDMTSDGQPLMFSLNKYRQSLSKLANAERWTTDGYKNRYMETGFINKYDGVDLYGFSGQKKQADGNLIVPDKRIFGIAGKIGTLMQRGEVRVLQGENIDEEKTHIKVTGYTFGYVITKPENIAKMVLK